MKKYIFLGVIFSAHMSFRAKGSKAENPKEMFAASAQVVSDMLAARVKRVDGFLNQAAKQLCHDAISDYVPLASAQGKRAALSTALAVWAYRGTDRSDCSKFNKFDSKTLQVLMSATDFGGEEQQAWDVFHIVQTGSLLALNTFIKNRGNLHAIHTQHGRTIGAWEGLRRDFLTSYCLKPSTTLSEKLFELRVPVGEETSEQLVRHGYPNYFELQSRRRLRMRPLEEYKQSN